MFNVDDLVTPKVIIAIDKDGTAASRLGQIGIVSGVYVGHPWPVMVIFDTEDDTGSDWCKFTEDELELVFTL